MSDSTWRSLIRDCYNVFREMDLYKILQLNSNAGLEEIRHAYYKLMRIYHGDSRNRRGKVVGEDEEAADEKSKLINNLYNKLCESRKEYDRNKEDWERYVSQMEDEEAEQKGPPYFYYGSNGEWVQVTFRRSYSIDSLILAEGVLQRLIDDIEEFLNTGGSSSALQTIILPQAPSTSSNVRPKQEFKHRGYLLYGNPRTGKSNFILAMARKLKFHIYQVSLRNADLDDAGLMELFKTISSNSFVLISDVDVVMPYTGEDPNASLNPLKPEVDEECDSSSDSSSDSDDEEGEDSDEVLEKMMSLTISDPFSDEEDETNDNDNQMPEEKVSEDDAQMEEEEDEHGGTETDTSDGDKPDEDASTAQNEKKEEEEKHKSEPPRCSSVTFNGLRESLKVVANQENRVVFLTSDKPHFIGRTPLRPGFIDVKQHFSNCDRSMVKEMFKNSYEGCFKYKEEMCEKFVRRLCRLRKPINPRCLSVYLRMYKGDPRRAIRLENIKSYFR